ncbi:hypothetical protein ERJ75_000711100 [Trypanosoma vivax]|uniref:Uncharacterized protein n=1 Tax=Trypanosoma vivax (strain Y486) TaxID=1055687 RepID=G0TTW0_TRYVY|nr:hypothetical protein TRVL_02608 [Trypanosoma vivax]KAH8613840.1 hypothetical protein ERJ75_000711100 [Trypanosoma vivax]CCC47393.1 conserved hypothetical protein [Trypanosoma vivax Y486]
MRHNVEASGVHLADCTLLWYRREIEIQEEHLAAAQERRLAASTIESRPTPGDLARQEASHCVRTDGELISTRIELAALCRAVADREARAALELKHQEEIQALQKLQDHLRHIIIDEWALAVERLEEMEWKERGIAQGKKRYRMDFEWVEAAVQQYLVDEMRLWSDEEQVMQRDREEGRREYKLEQAKKGKVTRGGSPVG